MIDPVSIDPGVRSMARKRKDQAPMPATAETTIKPVRLDLSPEVHRLLRLVAAAAEKPMAVFAREAVENLVRAEAKKRGLN